MTRQGSTATAILFTPRRFGRAASPADPARSLVQDWFPDVVAAAEQLLDGLSYGPKAAIAVPSSAGAGINSP
ncbi:MULTISPECIES: hypothetical protein [Streptomyces]|uniref:hypothetical protein n=1 Tax=Streptomyces TaxID=1883 RepID=UPI00131C6FE4|nr:hypothetical protein [Streptomyces sp. CB02120-2]